MSRIRTRISVAGLTGAEIAEGLSSFRQYLGERTWLINPQADWDAEQSRLLVTVETEGVDPALESEATFDEVWDCVIAAFDAAGTVSFDILGAESVGESA
jgi:hypothetical protein